jgi:hypothetical protein
VQNDWGTQTSIVEQFLKLNEMYIPNISWTPQSNILLQPAKLIFQLHSTGFAEIIIFKKELEKS